MAKCVAPDYVVLPPGERGHLPESCPIEARDSGRLVRVLLPQHQNTVVNKTEISRGADSFRLGRNENGSGRPEPLLAN